MIEFWFWSQNTKNANRTFHKGEWGKTRHKIGSSLNGGSLVTKLTMLKEEEGLSITLQHGYIHKPHFILSFSDVRLLQTTAEGLLHIDDTLSNIQRGLWMVIKHSTDLADHSHRLLPSFGQQQPPPFTQSLSRKFYVLTNWSLLGVTTFHGGCTHVFSSYTTFSNDLSKQHQFLFQCSRCPRHSLELWERSLHQIFRSAGRAACMQAS